MIAAKELARLKIGDVIDSGVTPLLGLSGTEALTFTVKTISKKGVVSLVASYFGVRVGEYAAKANGEKVMWVDVDKSRREKGHA